jgi:hypothetical protein
VTSRSCIFVIQTIQRIGKRIKGPTASATELRLIGEDCTRVLDATQLIDVRLQGEPRIWIGPQNKENELTWLPIDEIVWKRFHCESLSRLGIIQVDRTPRRTDEDWEDERGGHQTCKKGQSLIVVSIDLP